MEQWEFVSQRVEDPNTYYGKSLIISDTTGNNVTESIIRNPDYQLVVNSYNLSTADKDAFKKLNDFCAKAYSDNIATAVLVSAENSDIAKFVKENNLDIDKVMKILMDNNIKAQKDQTLKAIAEENDY
ncbi:MAG: hypothetical protein HGA42_18325 [Nostocales cyanobacterium W4_Combined_metabat2_030]|nr:hypothetical protein [Nostocales cyanobacterium W4_Combined_metabat2_030]